MNYLEDHMFDPLRHNGHYTFPDGTKYYGQLNTAGKPDGIGRAVTPINQIQEGTWKDGIVNGWARLLFPNGNVYEGNIHNNTQHGRGLKINPNGEKHDGMF